MLRAGNIVYDELTNRYRVEKINVLSSMIVYAELIPEERYNNYSYPVAMYNRTATRYAEYISNDRLHKTFFFELDDAIEARNRLARNMRRQSLGHNIEEIIGYFNKKQTAI